jgi:hypothetical protein
MVLKRNRNMLGQVLGDFNVNFSAFYSVYIVCISWNNKEIRVCHLFLIEHEFNCVIVTITGSFVVAMQYLSFVRLT